MFRYLEQLGFSEPIDVTLFDGDRFAYFDGISVTDAFTVAYFFKFEDEDADSVSFPGEDTLLNSKSQFNRDFQHIKDEESDINIKCKTDAISV